MHDVLLNIYIYNIHILFRNVQNLCFCVQLSFHNVGALLKKKTKNKNVIALVCNFCCIFLISGSHHFKSEDDFCLCINLQISTFQYFYIFMLPFQNQHFFQTRHMEDNSEFGRTSFSRTSRQFDSNFSTCQQGR